MKRDDYAIMTLTAERLRGRPNAIVVKMDIRLVSSFSKCSSFYSRHELNQYPFSNHSSSVNSSEVLHWHVELNLPNRNVYDSIYRNPTNNYVLSDAIACHDERIVAARRLPHIVRKMSTRDWDSRTGWLPPDELIISFVATNVHLEQSIFSYLNTNWQQGLTLYHSHTFSYPSHVLLSKFG
ncbi:hypothetical protein BDP27DRAFT_865779 [Rhodocollybia butyracea]|uniref:Uncharacterized protein n=1 Tax=Rhodocollybia butyracea TaxID=206335 RepID=A0A9P5P746_9AGAR|nr:hypothetical protein BDP27DRAFT_865779 [Rhodocollybia butyracea]